MVLEQLDNTMGENVDHYLTAHEKINSRQFIGLNAKIILNESI